jgi:hypothetical protein
VHAQPYEILIQGDFASIIGSIERTPASVSRDTERTELRRVEITRRPHHGCWRVLWSMDGTVQKYTTYGNGLARAVRYAGQLHFAGPETSSVRLCDL